MEISETPKDILDKFFDSERTLIGTYINMNDPNHQEIYPLTQYSFYTERKRLALGPFFDKLNLSEEENLQMVSDIKDAKKYEKDIMDKIQSDLEAQEVNKISSNVETQDQALLSKCAVESPCVFLSFSLSLTHTHVRCAFQW